MSNAEGLPEREGTAGEIAVTRYYYDERDGVRRHLDFDGRLWTSEAVAVKKTAQLSAQALLDGVEESEPEALRAFVWLLRKHRGGEHQLKLTEVELDLTSVRRYNLDADGVRLLTRSPDIDWARVDVVAKMLRAELPALPEDTAQTAAVLAVQAAAEAVESPGEGSAGSGPAPGAGDLSLTTSSGPSPESSLS